MTGVLARIHGGRVFYLFILPFAVLTAIFGVWPILLSIDVSLTASATALRPEPRYVGLENYVDVLTDRLFVDSLLRTIGYAAVAVIANLAFALAMATLLAGPWLGSGGALVKLAIFLPVVTPDVAGYVVWRWLFDSSFGAVNAALDVLSLPAFRGLTSPDTALISILLAELWHHAGFYMIIFMANLAIVDKTLDEAARVDGAGPWTRWRRVTLPQLRPALIVNTVYATIQFLKTFTVVVVMTRGGPADSTNFVSYFAYQLFDQGRYGEATAMATVLFVIVAVLSLAMWSLSERRDWR